MNETTVTAAVVEPEAPVAKNWFTELIERLKMVITKLLLKFGIKIGL